MCFTIRINKRDGVPVDRYSSARFVAYVTIHATRGNAECETQRLIFKHEFFAHGRFHYGKAVVDLNRSRSERKCETDKIRPGIIRYGPIDCDRGSECDCL